ncbi:MAG TPA: hypothetical protein VNR11_03975 [Xanthobacteraceae bacterium]|nr:hypothetical protein [Xanthobacteraceae bacterium]
MHEFPICPNCLRIMALVRPLPRVGEERQVNVFECRACKVILNTAGYAPPGADRRD